jgi:hypothetical protein
VHEVYVTVVSEEYDASRPMEVRSVLAPISYPDDFSISDIVISEHNEQVDELAHLAQFAMSHASHLDEASLQNSAPVHLFSTQISCYTW